MKNVEIYKDIAKRTNGDIYFGVVGPVRTGKSTFIKNFMERFVIPNIENEYNRTRALDELPQSASGKTIMTTEPKFIPNESVEVSVDNNVRFKTRLVDCVGYLIDGVSGHMENDMPRMVKTPWQEEEMPFSKAAEIGTKKVIEDHSTIGIVVTTDGTITGIDRQSYVQAEERVINLEYNAFTQIREEIAKNIKRLQKTAMVVSTVDVLTSFAVVAEDMNYCMPKVNSQGIINIKNGRHPVIEKMLGAGEFVENDTYLDESDNRLAIITGPNMAGKSTYMRQVALITLMAQIGSYVPASEARIGVVDKIFTRVGASDDLSMGQSTFMVEMMEVATILKEATKNSLVILDEIGRGTSTYDGLSIAWAVAEFIADKEKCGAKTLFATHYHELIGLEEKLEGVKNYSIAVKEKGEDIIFLRKIVRGGTDESYGIHVARLAGVPKQVTSKANEILRSLERKNVMTGKAQEKKDKKQVEGQFDMFNYKLAEIAHELDKVNLNELTPIDALNTLVKIKEKMK